MFKFECILYLVRNKIVHELEKKGSRRGFALLSCSSAPCRRLTDPNGIRAGRIIMHYYTEARGKKPEIKNVIKVETTKFRVRNCSDKTSGG